MLRHILRVATIGALAACTGGNRGTEADAEASDTSRPDAAGDGAADAATTPAGVIAVPLTSIAQLTYTAALHVGGQPEQVILDTGSTTLGVAGSACSSCGVSPVYTPGPSATDMHATATATYADGTGWTGEIYDDAVVLGSAADVAVKLVDMTSSNGFFRSFDGTGNVGYEGILGLGPDASLLAGTTSYITQSFAAGVTEQFAFQLCPNDGTMWVGGVDASAEAAAPAVTALNTGFPYYAVFVDNMAVGSGAAIGNSGDFGPTIIDTGTSISFIPTTVLTAVTAAIQSSAGYQSVFDTQSLTDASTMGCVTTTKTGAEIDAALPPLHIAFPRADGSGDAPYVDLPATKAYLLYSGPSGTGSDNSWCYDLADAGELGGESLFGDSILNAYVAVFDIADQQMQFAASKGCGEADAIARPARATPRVPGVPWWKQDPRVRLPDVAAMQRRLAAYRAATRAR